jgi:hypothetical protein
MPSKADMRSLKANQSALPCSVICHYANRTLARKTNSLERRQLSRKRFSDSAMFLDNLYQAMSSISRTCEESVIDLGLLRTNTFCIAPAAIAS